jgi:nucleolar protein 12
LTTKSFAFSMDEEYKVGALSDLISGKDADASLANLFTTDKKQKEQKVIKKKRKSKQTKTDDEKKAKRPKTEEDDADDANLEEDEKKYTQPSLKRIVQAEDEKERKHNQEHEERSIFIGNLPVATKEKQLRRLFAEFGTIETVRFRGAARPDLKTTKKVAVIKRTIHENRHNISAYVRFENQEAAHKAAEAKNGAKVGDNVVRVDSAVPKKHEQKMGVFVGNMSYDMEENVVHEHFSKCGAIADVRIVRDNSTGIGKGFGYVNFESEDSVEIALRLNGSDLGGRSVRVNRCVRKTKVNLPPSAATAKKKEGAASKKDPPKKVTRKKVKEMKATAFQGEAFDKKDGKKGKKKKADAGGKQKMTKGDKMKKNLSQKLLKT